MECKDVASLAVSEHTGINRNIVECKVNYGESFKMMNFVLIETLWNVKVVRTMYLVLLASVLIETLWNVKKKAGVRGRSSDAY